MLQTGLGNKQRWSEGAQEGEYGEEEVGPGGRRREEVASGGRRDGGRRAEEGGSGGGGSDIISLHHIRHGIWLLVLFYPQIHTHSFN